MALVKNDYKIAGTTVEIHAQGNGSWYVHEPVEGSESVTSLGSGDTLEKAIAQARVNLNKRKVKVDVPFVTAEGRRGVAHGIHVKTHDVLVRYASGEADTLGGYGRKVFRPDTPAEVIKRIATIEIAQRDLTRELYEIQKTYGIELKTLVRDAIDAAAREEVTA